MKTEKIITPFNGYIAVGILLAASALAAYGINSENIIVFTPYFKCTKQ